MAHLRSHPFKKFQILLISTIIYRITDLDMSSGLDNAFYQSSTDKIILSNTNDSQDFDTQVHVLDASRDSIVPLFTVASIETNGAILSDWSAENFLFI